jgi:membrane protein
VRPVRIFSRQPPEPRRRGPRKHIIDQVKLGRSVERFRHFFQWHIWSAPPEPGGRGRALLYRAGRLIYATARGFREKDLTSRAAALTYYTVLSIVPFLAFAFSILKGFGVYQRLMKQSVDPYVHQTFSGNPTLLRAIEQLMSFVEHTSVSGLSLVGILLLGYTSISMLSTVETALNGIWEASSARSLLRKVTDYTTILVFGPLLVLVAIAFSAAAQSSAIVGYLHESLLLGDVVDLMLRLTSGLVSCLALVVLYLIMPNVHTRPRSALLGGVVAGLLWQGLLYLHVNLQIGVANYNALYSGFAAFPIFLVWLYVSWVIVLIGAQLAASHQYEPRLRQAVRARHVDQELREALAVAVAAAVVEPFVEGRPAATATTLANALEEPAPAVEHVLDALVREGVLVRVAQHGEPGYAPARDIDGVHLFEVEEAVRRDPDARPLKSSLEQSVGPVLGAVLRARREPAASETGALTLRQLAAQYAVRFAAAPVEQEARH